MIQTTEAMREQKKWMVKSDINDTNAPNNVFEYFWLECEDGEELTISPDHDPRPNGTDRVKEYLEGLAERLNSADELRQLREIIQNVLNKTESDQDVIIIEQGFRIQQLTAELDKVKTTHYQELNDQLVQDNESLTAEVERLRNPYQCKVKGQRLNCANEVCWDLNECQGTKDQKLSWKIEKLKGLLCDMDSEFKSLQSAYKIFPPSVHKSIHQLRERYYNLTEIESTLNPGER